MFWYILLAHFIADYPLQPPWIVRNKTRFWVLFLHASIHFITMIIILGLTSIRIWPYLVALACIHFIIDAGKNFANKRRPDIIFRPYVIDQTCHYLSIWLVTIWIQSRLGQVSLPGSRALAIYLIAYLLATYVWLVSERILSYREPDYQKEVIEEAWPRMVVRAGLLTALLLVVLYIRQNATPQPGAVLALGIAIRPYTSSRQGTRALLTDIAVAACAAAFVLLTT